MRDSGKLTAAVTALTEGGDHSSPLVRMARSVQVFALPPNRKPMSSLSRLKTEKERSVFLTLGRDRIRCRLAQERTPANACQTAELSLIHISEPTRPY